MNICVFDTETTSLEKPFCYNIGYTIVDTDRNFFPLIKKDFVVEQVWHNLMLFSTAYYASKREIYIQRMRAKETVLNKFGYICQEMIRDFKAFDVSLAFAFNSSFDEKVFNFNCDWFKCINPFENITVRDIRGFVHNFIVTRKYKEFCEENSYFTESGNYSTTAEIVYRFLFNENFVEEHTALADALIESEILSICVHDYGANIENEYKTLRSIERTVEKTLHIKTVEQVDFYFDYNKIKVNKDKTEIVLK